MTPRSIGRERFLQALRGHTQKTIEARALQVMIGVVEGIGSSTSGFSVSIPEHGFTLDSDNILVTQPVAQYDQDYGLKVGDSLVVECTAAGDWIAVGVLTDVEAVLHPTRTYVDDGDAATLAAAEAYAGSAIPIGTVIDYAGPGIPAGPALWQACDGTSLLRTGTYAGLFAALGRLVGSGTATTVTIASPGVWTTSLNHGLTIGDPVYATTTGALPTGLTAGIIYYVMTVPTATTFTLGTTRTFSINSTPQVTTAVNTSGTQSGVQNITHLPHGAADATHFYAPDMRDKVSVGTSLTKRPGFTGGEETHLLGVTEMPAHAHGVTDPTHNHGVGGAGAAYIVTGSAGALAAGGPANFNVFNTTDASPTGVSITNTGGGGAHNNLQPFIGVQKFVRYA